MKNIYFLTVLVFLIQPGFVKAQEWNPVQEKITTPWAEEVDPENPLPEYPRPQMVREDWQNLNGLWEYTVFPKIEESNIPSSFSGNILVPFAIDLSLVGQRN
jgi:hypothetical protein